MNNYFNPGYFNFRPATALAGSAIKSGFKWKSLFTGAQKALNIANQAIPVFYQIKPVWNNTKTLFKVFGEFGKINKPDAKAQTTQPNTKNTTVSNSNNEKVVTESNNYLKPKFFI